jgi:hypothetical protein
MVGKLFHVAVLVDKPLRAWRGCQSNGSASSTTLSSELIAWLLVASVQMFGKGAGEQRG